MITDSGLDDDRALLPMYVRLEYVWNTFSLAAVAPYPFIGILYGTKKGVRFNIGKLSARRIQICGDCFCMTLFRLFFKITFQIMSKQKWSPQIQNRLVEYSSFKVSDP